MTKLLSSSIGQLALLSYASLLGLSSRAHALQLQSANHETGLQSNVCGSADNMGPRVGSSTCDTLYNELDCISATGVYQGFCSWDYERCVSGMDGEKTDCDGVVEDACFITHFSVLRPCMWLSGIPQAPISTRVPMLLQGTQESLSTPTETTPQPNRPTTLSSGLSNTSPFSTAKDLFGMDQYPSTTSGKRTSLRAAQPSCDFATSRPDDVATPSLHWENDWRPDLSSLASNEVTSPHKEEQQLTTYPGEMEQTTEESLDTPTNEEAKEDTTTPTLEQSFSDERNSTSQLTLTSATSAAGSASPFLGWVMIIVAFVFAEILFACCCYRNWTNEDDDDNSNPAQLDLTILCDDTDNAKSRPMECALSADDESMSNRDPTVPSKQRCTTP